MAGYRLRRRIAHALAAAAAAVACGGSATDGTDPGGAGTTGGNGGSAAGSSGGAAGSGGAPGGSGGALGGSGGAPGGSGGALGGSGGTSGVDGWIEEICAKLIDLPCSPGEKDRCMKEAQDEIARAQGSGCYDLFAAFLECAADGPIDCRGDEPQFAERCTDAGIEYGRCLGGTEPCSVGGGVGPDKSCSIDCPEAAATCQAAPGATVFECRCTSGSNPGQSFQSKDCPPSRDELDAMCG